MIQAKSTPKTDPKQTFRRAQVHRVRQDGKGYAFVVTTAAFFETDEAVEALLEAPSGELSGDDVVRLLGGRGIEPEVAREILDEMVELEVLAPVVEPAEAASRGRRLPLVCSTFEPKEVRYRDLPHMQDDVEIEKLPLTNLTVDVAMDCNLRCTYCYADWGRCGGEANMMCEGTAKRYVDLLLASAGAARDLALTFFGGEPLMNFEVMKAAVAYGNERAREEGKRIRWSMTTNGTLLKPRIIEWIVENGVDVTVSIDGPKDVNDAQRPTAGGKGSYDAIMRAVKPLLGRAPVAARVTMTSSCVDVFRIVDHLLAEGFHDVGISPVSSGCGSIGLGAEHLPEFMAGMRRASEKFAEAALAGRFYGFTNIRSILKQVYDGIAKSHPCGAGMSLTAGSNDEHLYLCHRFVGMEDYRIGTLEDGIDEGKRERFLADGHVSRKSPCTTCWARTLCSGGCYYVSDLHYQNTTTPHTPYCDMLREWYELGLRIYVRLLEGNPNMLAKLVGIHETCTHS